MSRGNPRNVPDEGARYLASSIHRVLFDDSGVERSIDPQSLLAREISASSSEVSQHFLRQLPQHCTMLAAALADALEALARLDPSLAFSGVVVARGLLEAAADLYWLSDAAIGHRERARRTFLIYLTQHESQVREIEHLSKRLPAHRERETAQLTTAVDQGWESLRQTAREMASAGYQLKETKKPGSRYQLGSPKPPVGKLVDQLISDHLGTTSVPIYSLYSSVAHAEGEGLGSLRVMDASIETQEGKRYARGFDAQAWTDRVLSPAVRGAAGALSAWTKLAHPGRCKEVAQHDR